MFKEVLLVSCVLLALGHALPVEERTKMADSGSVLIDSLQPGVEKADDEDLLQPSASAWWGGGHHHGGWGHHGGGWGHHHGGWGHHHGGWGHHHGGWGHHHGWGWGR
ncbi:hypothetical protein CBL_04449 [Carabus blaptoides fortunei]